MPRQSEPSANNALADLLSGMMYGCDILSESTQTIAGKSGLRPDIIVNAHDRAPVVIEAEYLPAHTVEQEARSRLGLKLADGGETIEAAVALAYPEHVADSEDLRAAISNAKLSYFVITLEEEVQQDGSRRQVKNRFPESGWLQGSVVDLADLLRLVSVSPSAVNAASNALEQGIDRAVGVLDDMAESHPMDIAEIAGLLGMSDVPQTRRMACAVIANALVFHDRIAGMHPQIKRLNLLWRSPADNPQRRVADTWGEILDINYWPIFAVARDIVNRLPPYEAGRILDTLRTTAQRINSTGAGFAHDLTGRIFQRLISDRKYLATFYTLPASAALLARLAVAKLQGIDWSDSDAIAKLKVGDFACGTGALLSAVYEQIATKHEQAGGNPAALHKTLMEDVLYGCDVMPSAIHITSSTLSGIQPNEGYGSSRLYTMPYGRQSDGSVAIGSLELLQSSSVMTLFNMSNPALRTGSAGEETAARVIAEIPDNAFDIVIMNPPFTRATNHEGAHANVVNPAFAAFNASKTDMDAMGKRMRDLGKGSCYDGKAGLASAFTALAHRKLKSGGVLAFVLPLSVASGISWQKFRQSLATEYTDLDVISIAANGKDMSFSADTGIAECLIIARKLHRNETASGNIHFTSLNHRPSGFAQASEISKEIINAADVRNIEDGPYGGTPILVGTEQIGEKVKSEIA